MSRRTRRDRPEEPELGLAADALLATIQGALLQPASRAEREQVIRYALRAYLPQSSGANVA